METIVLMVIGWLFLVPIGMEGACCGFMAPLIARPTTKVISENRSLGSIFRTISTTPGIPTNCPPLFTYNNTFSKCYYVHNVKQDFIDGNNTCVGLGGSLVMPKTTDEQVFVAQMIPLGTISTAYVGITYRTINGTSDYYYLDGTPFSSCTYALGSSSSFSMSAVLCMRKSDHCFTNLIGGNLIYIICEATPF